MKVENTKIRIIKARINKFSHAVSPIREASEDSIRRACRAAFKKFEKMKFRSLVFPALGCPQGFPVVGSAKIITQEILRYLRWNKTALQEVILCLEDYEEFRIFKSIVEGYIHHIQNDMGKGPYVTVDAIIELPSGIILIERSNPPYGWALPGGFVDYGESLEDAVIREAKEETHMTITSIRQFHSYSDPDRDPRFHTIGTVFICRGKGRPKFGDDAKGLKVVRYRDLLKLDYAFDHKSIIRDYLKARSAKKSFPKFNF